VANAAPSDVPTTLSDFNGSIQINGAPQPLIDLLTKATTSIDPAAHNLSGSAQILAAALADYHFLVQLLYDNGYFGPDISIMIDGYEASTLIPRELSPRVRTVQVTVNTGPIYQFGRASVAPLAPNAHLPKEFATGKTATTGTIRTATSDAIHDWNDAGYAKAALDGQQITAVHSHNQLNVDVKIRPGRQLRFGKMDVNADSRVRDEAIHRIAGFPEGEVFSPAQVKVVSSRLQRTGAFSGVVVVEHDTANPDGTLDFTTTISDQKKRRLSLGGEFSSRTGLDLSAVWTHRNLRGAAERLQLEARIRNIGGQDDVDGLIGFRFAEPAKLGKNATLVWTGSIELRDKPFYRLHSFGLGVGYRRILTDDLFYQVTMEPKLSVADDAFGASRPFDYVLLPLRIEWDKRNDGLNPTRGLFIQGTMRAMGGLNATKSALGLRGDGRLYHGFGNNDRFVLAGRVVLGTTAGAEIADISPEFLFYSGGAGTVRGQPHEELGVLINNSIAGGRSTFVWNAEARIGVTRSISVVGFYDYGAVGANQFIDASASAHSGAGIGVRYDVPGFGPLRADFGWPKIGDAGTGLQIYLGIGQAF
jgi:translocation and assembly module TamA